MIHRIFFDHQPAPKKTIRICSGKISLCYNAAIMLENFHFANNNNDNDDGYIVGRSLAG